MDADSKFAQLLITAKLYSEATNEMKLLYSFVPGLSKTIPSCCIQEQRVSVKDFIIHLNDTHKYTFDEIADYLDRLPFDLNVRESY